ncbi:MAG: recombination protein RecR [Candidatus Vogelbacteria bacterium]|nr:recombination protein RecR [Candidatus Vogelbacteria bacterium]
MTSDNFERLVETFLKFPGIGPRQARRFVYHLIRQDTATLNSFLDDIKTLKKAAGRCSQCQRFYTLNPNAKSKTVCELCGDETRDQSLLMVIEKDIDLENVKKSGTYNGHFFVLGSLPSMTEQAPIIRRSQELLARVKEQAPKEIILALSATAAGDHALELLKELLSGLKTQISVLGRGLSTGTELEYSDADTIKNALKNRG